MIGRTNAGGVGGGGGSGGGARYAVTIKRCGENAKVTARGHERILVTRADENGVAVFEKVPRGIWTFTSDVNAAQTTIEVYGETTTSLLPSSYKEVEYLESNEAQYITTSFIPDNTSGIYLEASMTEPATDGVFVGVRQTASGDNRWLIGHDSTGYYLGFNKIETSGRTALGRNVSTYELNWLNDRDRKVNGNQTQPITVTLASITNRAMLFAANVAGNPSLHKASRIYVCRFSKEDKIVADFIPCIRTEDNVPGMYDIVNGVFYENENKLVNTFTTGSFISGFTPLRNAFLVYTAPYGYEVTATVDDVNLPSETIVLGDDEMHIFTVGSDYFDKEITVECEGVTNTATFTTNTVIELRHKIYLFEEGVGTGNYTITRFTGTQLTYDSDKIFVQSGTSGTYSFIISPAVSNIHNFKTLQVKANVGSGYGTCEFGLCKTSVTKYDDLKNSANIIVKLAPSVKNAIETYTVDLSSIPETETSAYFYTMCQNGIHSTYFYDIVLLP